MEVPKNLWEKNELKAPSHWCDIFLLRVQYTLSRRGRGKGRRQGKKDKETKNILGITLLLTEKFSNF